MKNNLPKAIILGCSGLELTSEEQHFFQNLNPFGFILFQRNCETPEQVRMLVKNLRQLTGRPDTPILIDQEGGRVARLKPPHWPVFPSARLIGNLAKISLPQALEAASLQGLLIGLTLADLGINVNCAPVADTPILGADQVIGDRAYSEEPYINGALACAFAGGSMQGGVLPIAKHIPGHGRALVDSHKKLPIILASKAELKVTDFLPFQMLSQIIPLAMTAHITYTALDPQYPTTLSSTIINIIRQEIGFKGLLLSDDFSMGALAEALPGKMLSEQAVLALKAGVDLILHCNGKMEEMQEISSMIPSLTPQQIMVWNEAQEQLSHKQLTSGISQEINSRISVKNQLFERFAEILKPVLEKTI